VPHAQNDGSMTSSRLVRRPSPRPPTSRLPWARSALGGALVVGSVAGVLYTLTTGSETTTVVVANTPLAVGALLAEADTRFVDVPLHPLFDVALDPASLAGSLFVTSPIAEGSVIPHSAVSPTAPSDDTTVTLQLSVGQPAWLRAGAVAELWVAPPEGANGFGAPFVVSPQVAITAVSRDDGFAADALASRVDVLVPRRDLPSVIHALANGFYVQLTPVMEPGP
jgi:hypothetical protein